MRPLSRRWQRVLVAAMLAGAAAGAFAASPEALLEPEKAFRLTARPLGARQAELEFRIAPGYYMYRERFRFETATGEVLGGAEFPPGKAKQDPFFGTTEIYRDRVRVRVRLPDDEASRPRVRLKVTSQGCADQSVCYVPQEQWVELERAPATKARTR